MKKESQGGGGSILILALFYSFADTVLTLFPTVEHCFTESSSSPLGQWQWQGRGVISLALNGEGARHKRLVFFLPNNQRQHRTLHIQKDVLPEGFAALRMVLCTVPHVSRCCVWTQG